MLTSPVWVAIDAHNGDGGGEVGTLIPISFEFPRGLAPKARRVAIVGSFNGWDATAHPLTKMSGGDWAITVYFPAGRIVYGFDVDGVFWLDPFDETRMPNGWGSEYSIRYVRLSGDPYTPRSGSSARLPKCEVSLGDANTSSLHAIRTRGGERATRRG
jgi:hypothetical protein